MPVIHIGKPSEAALDRLHRFFHELILEILSGKRKCKPKHPIDYRIIFSGVTTEMDARTNFVFNVHLIVIS